MLERSSDWYNKRKDQLERQRLAQEKKKAKVQLQVKKKKPRQVSYFDRESNKWQKQNWKNWKLYSVIVRRLTREADLSLLPDIEKRDFYNYQLDHIVSVWDGYKHNIPPEMIADISNLRVITTEENNLKSKQSVPDNLKNMLDQLKSRLLA